jgi:hypothetical protein
MSDVLQTTLVVAGIVSTPTAVITAIGWLVALMMVANVEVEQQAKQAAYIDCVMKMRKDCLGDEAGSFAYRFISF